MQNAPPSSLCADSNLLFQRLVEEIKGKPEFQQRVVAHIRSKHGHATLPAFHNNGVSEQDKFKTYGECLAAIIKAKKGEANAWDNLLGQVPKGQAMPTEVAAAAAVPASRDELAQTRTDQPVIIVPVTSPAPPVAPIPARQPETEPDAAVLIAQAMRKLSGNGGLTVEQVEAIIDRRLANIKTVPDEATIKQLVEKSVRELFAGITKCWNEAFKSQ